MPSTDPEPRASRFLSLVYPHFPIEIPTPTLDDSWHMTGAAFVARMTGALEAILHLRPLHRVTDGIVLARSLFDHAVTFAWLAAETGPDHQRRFVKSDSAERLRLDDDCRRLGFPMLMAEMRIWHESNVQGLERQMPSLEARATEADEYWEGRIPGIRSLQGMNSYRGIYATLFRHHSSYAHPSALGVQAVTTGLPNDMTRVKLEDATDPDPLVLANMLFFFSLLVSAQTLGWPDSDDVMDVWL